MYSSDIDFFFLILIYIYLIQRWKQNYRVQ